MELYPYQKQAVEFLKRNPVAGLLMDMGLGKTTSTLHALVDLPKPVLLVGPIRVIETVWMQEAAQWPATRGLTFSLVRGTPTKRAVALKAKADIYLVNPELLEEALELGEFKTLVIDESSMFKNPSTKRFKTLRKYLKNFERRIILTGTPTPNSLLDIWSQVFILDRGERLDTSFGRFRDRYFQQADYFGYVFTPVIGAEERIAETISDITLRISAKGNLPPRTVIENQLKVLLPPAARKVYSEMEAEAFAKITEDVSISAASAAAALMKLRQVASGIVYNDDGKTSYIHDEKIKAVRSILEESSSPVVLVYHFKHELQALRKAFPQGVEFDPGLLPAWNDGLLPLMFLHPQSGGHGLNLQYGSHTMIIYSASFSYEHMSQTMARIDRQGQEFPVIFHHLIAEGTVDELILQVLKAKEHSQSTVLKLVKEYADAKTRNC